MQHENSKNAELILKAIGEVVKEIRLKQSKSQRLMSDEFSIPRSLLSRLENSINEPKIISIWSISEALGMKISDFFKLVEEKLPEEFSITEP